MKGLERDGIVVCGMDAFIESLYVNDPLEGFNIYYVACSRARKQLLINVTKADYATIRCSPLATGAQPKQLCEVAGLSAYVPFDPVLCVPENLFKAQVEIHVPDQAVALDRKVKLVEGRIQGTIEDLTPFMSRAISFKLIHSRQVVQDSIGLHGGEL
jgi:hypothetical protein